MNQRFTYINAYNFYLKGYFTGFCVLVTSITYKNEYNNVLRKNSFESMKYLGTIEVSIFLLFTQLNYVQWNSDIFIRPPLIDYMVTPYIVDW
jgi:hypothetical protein